MSDMHISVRALDVVRRRLIKQDDALPADIIACSGAEQSWGKFPGYLAELLVKGQHVPRDQWPTCPVCRVLLDAALEQRDLTPLLGGKPNV